MTRFLFWKQHKHPMEDTTVLKQLQSRFLAEYEQFFSLTIQQIEAKHKEILEEKEMLTQLFPKLQQKQVSDIIVLNVGGTKFTTTLSALRSQKGSFFAVMFSDRWNAKPLEDGSFFVDRDPRVFHHVLCFLREGTIDLTDLTPQEKKALANDASYYQLPNLLTILNAPSLSNNSTRSLSFNPAQISPAIALSNDNLTATYRVAAIPFCQRTVELNTVIPASSDATYRYKFKITKCDWVALGLADSLSHEIQEHEKTGHGYYLISSNGFIWHSDSASLNCTRNSFKFKTDDVLCVEYNGKSKMLNFSASKDRRYSMLVPSDSDLTPVVLLRSNSQVSIMKDS